MLNYLHIHNRVYTEKTTFNGNTKYYKSFAIIIYGIIHKVRKSHEHSLNASWQMPAVLHTNI